MVISRLGIMTGCYRLVRINVVWYGRARIPILGIDADAGRGQSGEDTFSPKYPIESRQVVLNTLAESPESRPCDLAHSRWKTAHLLKLREQPARAGRGLLTTVHYTACLCRSCGVLAFSCAYRPSALGAVGLFNLQSTTNRKMARPLSTPCRVTCDV